MTLSTLPFWHNNGWLLYNVHVNYICLPKRQHFYRYVYAVLVVPQWSLKDNIWKGRRLSTVIHNSYLSNVRWFNTTALSLNSTLASTLVTSKQCKPTDKKRRSATSQRRKTEMSRLATLVESYAIDWQPFHITLLSWNPKLSLRSNWRDVQGNGKRTTSFKPEARAPCSELALFEHFLKKSKSTR